MRTLYIEQLAHDYFMRIKLQCWHSSFIRVLDCIYDTRCSVNSLLCQYLRLNFINETHSSPEQNQWESHLIRNYCGNWNREYVKDIVRRVRDRIDFRIGDTVERSLNHATFAALRLHTKWEILHHCFLCWTLANRGVTTLIRERASREECSVLFWRKNYD